MWNCRRASAHHALWGYLDELNPDVAMLQEVGTIPMPFYNRYEIRSAVPRTKTGRSQTFASSLMVKGTIGNAVPLSSPYTWVREQLAYFQGNILAYEVTAGVDCVMNALVVYSPAWPVNKSAYSGEDFTNVKLSQNPDVWVTDLVTAALQNAHVNEKNIWVVAGDFNLCETFDSWKGGPRGNREWLDRMADLGLTECLRHHQGHITPTFRGPSSNAPNCQIDYMFVNQPLAQRLVYCTTGDVDCVFGKALSDHLPVIADFSRCS